ILPWLVYAAVNLAISVQNILWPETRWQPGWRFNLWLWFGLGIFADLLFALSARHQLLTSFHRLAMHRFNAKPKGFARWFGSGADSGRSHKPDDTQPARVVWWRRKAVMS